MTTLLKQISLFTEEQSTLLQAGFRASHTAQQASASAKKMTVTSGLKCLEQYAKFNRAGLLGKMFPGLLVGREGWFSTRCRLTWKLRGTKYSRLYFQLAVSTLRTEETGSGLLPTPRANQVNGCDLNSEALASRNKGNSEEVVAGWVTGLLPTPTATSDPKGGCMRKDPKYQNATLAHMMHGIHGEAGRSSQLNPQFVGEMMGFPLGWTELPFLNGEAKV
jgi:hypothetical protein